MYFPVIIQYFCIFQKDGQDIFLIINLIGYAITNADSKPAHHSHINQTHCLNLGWFLNQHDNVFLIRMLMTCFSTEYIITICSIA